MKFKSRDNFMQSSQNSFLTFVCIFNLSLCYTLFVRLIFRIRTTDIFETKADMNECLFVYHVEMTILYSGELY